MCKKILKGVSGTAVANYSYDACGNITQVSGKETVKYSYDGLNRLVREDNAALNKSYTYSYDAGGNITAKKEYAYTTGTLGAAVKTYNYVYGSNSWKDKLTSWNGQSITYDSYGNVKSYKGATYTWDRLNRLKSCVKSNGTTEYTYNVDGQPEKTELDYGNGMVGTTEREYVNGRLYKESKILTMNGAEIVSATMQYLYRGEEVIGLIYNGDLYYYRKNLQGDIIEIVDEDGNVAATYKYDAWGNWTVSGGDVGTYNSFRYRGYYYDTAIMLYYLKTRWYDPETGRFISPDSINYLDPQSINGLNLYAYCLNNPVMNVDPMGNIPFANGFTMFYSDIFIGGFYDKSWGQMSYNVVVNHGQTDETGLLYSVAGIDNISGSKKAGVGINVWGWLGVEGGYTADKNSKFNGVYVSANITPWLSGGINIDSNGIAVSIGVSIDNTTHEIRVGIGWNLLMIGLSFLAVILTGGAAAAMLA